MRLYTTYIGGNSIFSLYILHYDIDRMGEVTEIPVFGQLEHWHATNEVTFTSFGTKSKMRCSELAELQKLIEEIKGDLTDGLR